MKQIQNLIVVEVPKGVTKSYLILDELRYTTKPPHKMDYETIDLPPGQYEIIGLYSDMNVAAKLRATKAANMESMILTIGESFEHLLMTNQMEPTDTTDLLFIKKL